MKAERARLKRLQRLERVRAIAKQNAASQAAQAESNRAQLEALAERTRRLAADYAGQTGHSDGAALRQRSHFAEGLYGVVAATAGDARRAGVHADETMAELGRAERRRAVVEERADAQSRTIARKAEKPVLGTRRPVGTAFE